MPADAQLQMTAGDGEAGCVLVDFACAAALSTTVRERPAPASATCVLDFPDVGLQALELVGQYLRGADVTALLATVTQEQWRVVGQVAVAADLLRCGALFDASVAKLCGWITAGCVTAAQTNAWLDPSRLPPPGAPTLFDEDRVDAPIYNGCDPLSATYSCFAGMMNEEKHAHDDAAGEAPAEPLHVCGRCRVARYCCQECQRLHWPEHKADCRSIEAATSETKRFAEALRHQVPMFGGAAQDYFRTQVGRFYGILETRDYCRSRRRLVKAISDVAYVEEVQPLWEKVLAHQLELLRLSSNDNLGVRFDAMFVLLHLNRPQDCHGLIKHWLRFECDDERTWVRGEWPYPVEQDIYESMFEAERGAEPRYWDLNMLAALAIVKMRIVEKLRQRQRQWAMFALHPKVSGAAWMRNAAVWSALHRRVTTDGRGEPSDVAATQERHLMEYLRQMHANNKTILPAILNPRPLKQQPAPQYYTLGAASEAWGVLNECNRLFARIPHHREWIERVIGPHLADRYDAEIREM